MIELRKNTAVFIGYEETSFTQSEISNLIDIDFTSIVGINVVIYDSVYRINCFSDVDYSIIVYCSNTDVNKLVGKINQLKEGSFK